MVTEPELRRMLLQAYLNKVVEHFVEEGISPSAVDVEGFVLKVINMVDEMTSVEDDNGNIHFFHPSEEGFDAVFLGEQE